MGGMKRLSGVLLLPVLAFVLAACGAAEEKVSSVADQATSAAAEAGSGAAYSALDSAAGSFDEQVTTYATELQDCLNQATAEDAKVTCGQESLDTVKQGWAPVQSALDALSGVADGECKSQLDATTNAAKLWTEDNAPSSADAAEQLPSKLGNAAGEIQASIGNLASACT